MSDDNKALERLHAELDEWNARLGHLRVQANLGRKEAHDKVNELEDRLTHSFRQAKRRLDAVIETGSSEARTLGKDLAAGWDGLLRTHRELMSHEATQDGTAHEDKSDS